MASSAEHAIAPDLVRVTHMIRSAIAGRADGGASARERFLQAVAGLSMASPRHHVDPANGHALCARTQDVVIAYMFWHASAADCIGDMARLLGIEEHQFRHAFTRSVGVTPEMFVELLEEERAVAIPACG